MTIAERINLHKCGYTRAEIDALAKEEKEEKETPAPAPTEPETQPVSAPAPEPDQVLEAIKGLTAAPAPETDPVLEAIKGLTAAIQARNIHEDTQPEAKQETMTDLINQV